MWQVEPNDHITTLGWDSLTAYPLTNYLTSKTKSMENLTIQIIREKIWEKQDKQVELHSHPNRSLAVEMWSILQAEINDLRELGKSLLKS